MRTLFSDPRYVVPYVILSLAVAVAFWVSDQEQNHRIDADQKIIYRIDRETRDRLAENAARIREIEQVNRKQAATLRDLDKVIRALIKSGEIDSRDLPSVSGGAGRATKPYGVTNKDPSKSSPKGGKNPRASHSRSKGNR